MSVEKALVDVDALQDSIVGAYDLCHVRSSDVLDIIQELRAWRAQCVVAEEPEWEYGYELIELLHAFHRDIANQLIRTATKTPDVSSWAARAISLCGAAKWRRNVARRVFRLEHGHAAELEYRRELATKYPRAEWGSAL